MHNRISLFDVVGRGDTEEVYFVYRQFHMVGKKFIQFYEIMSFLNGQIMIGGNGFDHLFKALMNKIAYGIGVMVGSVENVGSLQIVQ